MEPSWNDRKLVGNDAENTVEYLVNSMPDWKCFKFGVENHIAELRRAVKENINPVTRQIKSMPDFVAFNIKTGQTLFLEVKYRTTSFNFITKKQEYQINFLEEYKQYWPGTRLIIVCDIKPYIFTVNLDKIEERMLRKEKGKGAFWNFEDVKEDIKKLFPELNDETFSEAVKRTVRK